MIFPRYGLFRSSLAPSNYSTSGAAILSFSFFNVWNTNMDAPASESVRSDAHLQPPGTATFQSTSFSSSVNAPPTLFSLEDEFISSTSPRDPTLEQEQAIATLKNYHNSDIIAWHTLSQSIAPGLRHRDGPGGLSIQVIHAISILRDFSRGCLIQLLESCICITNFLGRFQATDNFDSAQKIFTKPWPFRLQVHSCRVFTPDPTTVAEI